jgi:alanine-glyoxylate transaminase/serine-glyoxylate transaminase/serine-pyruvate transaminase
MAEACGVHVETLEFGLTAPVEPTALAARLNRDPDHRIRAVLVCMTDTATSVDTDIAALRQAIDDAAHPALLQVDCVASFCCAEFHMDRWGVDVTVTACQKGLMTPAGVAFNMFSEKALSARRAKQRVPVYWDWLPRIEPGQPFYFKFMGTPPTHHLFGLATALEMILREEGLDNVWARHSLLARAVWAAVEVWGAGGRLPIRLQIAEQAHRSVAVTTVRVAGHAVTPLRRWCQDRCGLTLGVPIAPMDVPDEVFRLGHMGHLSPPMILGTLATVEAGLAAVGIPHETGGVSAAAAVLVSGSGATPTPPRASL